jgi:hypothetical protein
MASNEKLDAIRTSAKYRNLVKRKKLNCLEHEGHISITVPEFELHAIIHVAARGNERHISNMQ